MSQIHEEKGVSMMVEHHDQNHKEKYGHIANQEEHEETALQSLRRHPKTIMWCVFALWVLLLSSFDNQAGGVVIGVPEFRKDFGSAFEGNYVLPAEWQSAYSGGPTASAVIGSLGASYIADKIGRKLVYLIGFVFVLVGITVETIATTNTVFFAGKFINGFAVGAFGTITMTYVGEIAPLALRGVITAAAGLSFTFGPFLVTLIVNTTGVYTTRWAYRAIFVAQYGVTILGLIGLPFMPESPWWLLSRGREEKAIHSLRRLGHSEQDIEKRVAYIKLTLDEVRKETEGVTFAECFRKSNLRRTIIAIMPLSIQAMCGISFIISYAAYYIQLAGYSAKVSFRISIGQVVLAMAGNIVSWFLVDRVGRRNLTIYGLTFVTATLLVSGGLGMKTGSIEYVKGVIALWSIYIFVYNATIGATAYNLLAEVATARLRAKTASIGLALQNALYTMWSFVLPYIFNPNEANLGAKTSFIFGGLSIISLVYLWVYQPETAGISYEELDEMFIKKIPARKFKGYVTEAQLRGQDAARRHSVEDI
ncbi:general substrate transporter [Hyaloscypha variabilis F]|uniref:General substrate transporter n=1 Tax=Hyaloscypha variabilis (strain UAMH 11265 / GT02V1 / F) TaxID=1149755 RepID=A0A2J6RP30_HYAVF|nr:general substrate transporter [Hyaloscypha variabilis F]